MTIKKKSLLLFLLVATIFFMIGLTVTTARAQQTELNGVNYEQTYKLGSTIAVTDATITYKGKDYPASPNVIFPDGNVYMLSSLTFTKSGNYTIEYRANADGKILIEKVSFSVNNELFSVIGNGDISYGTNSYLGDMKGVNVSLSSGSVLRYNRVVNVKDNIPGMMPILRMYCTPQIKGEREIERVRVKLTDAYNPDNYIEVLYKGDVAVDEYTYITGNANGQSPSGLEARTAIKHTEIVYDGYIWRLFQNDKQYGFNGHSSFSGVVPNGFTMEENYLELNMDYEQRRLYVQRAVVDPNRNLLIDLDEPLFFGDNLWNGFATGEVIVTIEGLSYNSANFNFFISEIDGHDLTADNVNDTTPPAIFVDYGEYSEDNLPTIVVGRQVKVFPATAYDNLEGAVNCSSFVYYNYNSSARACINVTDGCFNPTKSGAYTIVYKASDSFGNSAVKTVELNAIIRNQIDYSFSEHETEFIAGAVVSVADIQIANSIPGYSVVISAKNQSTDAVTEISRNTLSFKTFEIGDYSIEYVYSDYVDTQTFSYDIKVVAPNAPIFPNDVAIPRFFIKNCTYYIPDYYAYDYSDGQRVVKAEVFAKSDDKLPVRIENNSVKIEANERFEIIFKVGTAEKIYIGKVVDTNYGVKGQVNFKEYLQGDGFTSTAQVDCIEYSTDESLIKDGTATLSLINSAFNNVFDVEFSVGNAEFDGVDIVLTSETNRNSEVIISYRNNLLGYSDVTVRYGEKVVSDVCSNVLARGNSFKTSVFEKKLIVSDSGISIPSEEIFREIGNKFFVDIRLTGVSGPASIKISKLMNQLLSSDTSDDILPVLIYKPIRDDYKMGDLIEIDAFDYYDFVDPSPLFRYTVRSGSEIVSAEDGTMMNGTLNDYHKKYRIPITKYGTIKLSFVLNDYSVWSDNISGFVLNIEDDVPPTIELKIGKTAFKTGDIAIAEYTVSDNGVGKIDVDVMVIDAKGHISLIDGKKFNAPISGSYTVIYRAADESGNVSFAQYTVKVK